MRLAICSSLTTSDDIKLAWQVIQIAHEVVTHQSNGDSASKETCSQII